MNHFSYLYLFIQSNTLEIPIYFLFYFTLKGLGVSFGEKLKWVSAGVSLSNLLTHPIVFFLVMPLKLSFLTNILLAESFAILAETILHPWFFKVSYRRALIASIFANLMSWQLAPMLTYFIFYKL